jgi:glycosyltransferase involved in cell wall biosynthesis
MRRGDVVAATPIVSVVMATYNRSEALRYAITSVRRSTMDAWEVIVVGDACTDDTAEVVAAFRDPRIRFVNLPDRCGDQSGPNSHGIGLATGRFIAFLNHDDLYFPGHLEACVDELQSSGADLVWVPCARLLTSRKRLPGGRFLLSGVPGAAGYSPYSGYFASSWVFRRELAARVGPWSAPAKSYVAPSQAWLFRAWRMGAALRFLPKVGVILVPAGERPGCYARRECAEQAWLSDWMSRDVRCREQIVEEAALNEAMTRVADIDRPRLWSLRRFLLRPIYALSVRAGHHPASLSHLLTHGRRGNFVRFLRKYTGAD